MTLSACPCRVPGLDIPSYYIFCPISSSVTLMVKTLKLLCLSCQLLIHCVSSPSLPVLWQLRWTYKYFSFVSGHTRGERGFSSWFHCAFPGRPLQHMQLLQCPDPAAHMVPPGAGSNSSQQQEAHGTSPRETSPRTLCLPSTSWWTTSQPQWICFAVRHSTPSPQDLDLRPEGREKRSSTAWVTYLPPLIYLIPKGSNCHLYLLFKYLEFFLLLLSYYGLNCVLTKFILWSL